MAEIKLHDIYKHEEQGLRFLFHLICDCIEIGKIPLVDNADKSGYEMAALDVKLVINGEEHDVQKFFISLVKGIDRTIDAGIEEFAQQKAAPFLEMLNNLDTNIRQNIAQFAPPSYYED